MASRKIKKIDYEASLLDRIDSLHLDINKKILKYKYNKENKRFGMAEIEASEILELKSLLRSNEDIGCHLFGIEPEQGYYTN